MSRMLSRLWAPVALALFPLVHTGVQASTLQSHQRISQIELKSCKQIKSHPNGGAWLCQGLAGWPVYVAEGDLRHFVSAGRNPEKRRAATQTLRSFNSIFKDKSDRTVIEWRLGPGGHLAKPHAMIVRHYTSGDGKTGEVLAVHKISAEDSCHIAYIDARSNRDALVLARRIADERAPGFDCKSEPKFEGKPGPSPK